MTSPRSSRSGLPLIRITDVERQLTAVIGPSAFGTSRPKAEVDALEPRVNRLALHGEDAKDALMNPGQGLVLHEPLERLKP